MQNPINADEGAITTGPIFVRRALLSVSDKTGLVEFAQGLQHHGVALLASGGTAQALRAAGLPVAEVADYTGFPEILQGRVKTLHPKIHGGLLARRDRPADMQELERHGVDALDMLVVNLYPFGDTPPHGVESIDIGGPAMLRAAAKNHAFVAAVSDPADYQTVLREMELANGALSPGLRRALAAKAFSHTAAYDADIANWTARKEGDEWPARMTLALQRARVLRYGENPHQAAALYLAPGGGGVAGARTEGAAPGYNNYTDADIALALAAEFSPPAAVVVKHATPCGAACGETPLQAWDKAHAADSLSAFGGILALNRPLQADLAARLQGVFLEVIVAPDVSEDARALLAQRKKAPRLFLVGRLRQSDATALRWRSISGGGFLLQQTDALQLQPQHCRVATRRAPTPQEWRQLMFAWRVAKHARSNAVVCARDQATVGIGAGHTSRVDAAVAALGKAAENCGGALGAVAASDGFFPFDDGVRRLLEGGVRAIIQPGGSLRDADAVAAADEAGAAMVLTGVRHFSH